MDHIKVQGWTTYGCNHDYNGDLICLQSQIRNGPYMLANFFQQGQNMLAIIKVLFSRDASRNQSHVTLGRFPTLQAYLVPIERDCKHIWSVSDLRLQAYLVPFVTKIASIFGPCHINYCNHMCSFPKLNELWSIGALV